MDRIRTELLLISCLLFAGRFTEDFLVRQRVGEGRPAAGATIRQFVEAGEALDAARRPSGTDLIPRRSGRTQRPPRTRLEPGGSGGAERPPRAGSVSGQLGGSQRPPTSARFPGSLGLLFAVVRRLVAAFNAG